MVDSRPLLEQKLFQTSSYTLFITFLQYTLGNNKMVNNKNKNKKKLFTLYSNILKPIHVTVKLISIQKSHPGKKQTDNQAVVWDRTLDLLWETLQISWYYVQEVGFRWTWKHKSIPFLFTWLYLPN